MGPKWGQRGQIGELSMNLALLLESWLSLGVAIVFGVLGTISMKLSHGLQKPKPTIALIIFYIISFIGMTYAMKSIQLSIVYAVWSGVGTVLVALVGILYFNELLSARKIFFLSLIVLGVIGIHFGDGIASI